MNIRYLFLTFSVIDGERGYLCHDVASVSVRRDATEKDVEDAALTCAKNFFPVDEDDDVTMDGDVFLFFDGEVIVSLDKWKEISEEEFKFLNQLFYGNI